MPMLHKIFINKIELRDKIDANQQRILTNKDSEQGEKLLFFIEHLPGEN